MKATCESEIRWKPTRVARIAVFVFLLVTASAVVSHAQQLPNGRVAYTKYPLGGIDFKELWLSNSDHSNDHILTPQIQVGNLTAGVASLGVPTWSKDGRLITANAILSSGAPGLDPIDQILWGQSSLATPTNVLVVFDPSTNQGHVVLNVVSSQWITTAFSPDAKWIAYSQQELNFVDYGIVAADGSRNVPLFSVNLTENALGLGIDWSPRLDQLGSGGNLLVVSYPQSFSDPTCSNMTRTVAALFLIDLQTGAVRRLTQPQQPQQPCSLFVADPMLLLSSSTFSSVNDLWPVFSLDGTQVAFVRSVRDSMGNVSSSWIMTIKIDGTTYADGTTERALVYLPGEEVDHLTWSPDESRLMFDRTQMAYGGLYPNPLGIFTTSSAGGGDQPTFLAPPASAAAWARPQ